MRYQKLFILFLFFVVSACATYAPQYKNTDTTVSFPTDKEVATQFYLIGDAGKSPMGGMSPGLAAAKNIINDQDTSGDYAIYLGDNIYPVGLPVKGAEDRKYAENALNAQLKTVNNFDGTTYFIPGNHDWYGGGLPTLNRQQEYLIKKSGNDSIFQPMDGCPLKSISVSDDVQIIIIDSQWYLENWNDDPNFNKNCDIKSREKFFIEVDLEIRKNSGKTILFAMHHPMFTNGTHGGYYGLKKHLYPFQSKIPMPILASLITQVRTQGGVSVQDRYNELYNKLMNRLGDIARKHPRLIFASGHEHSLHHIEKDGLIQIQSGSASKESAGALGDSGDFSYGGHGFAIMTVFKDGATWVRYYGVENGENPKLLFTKEVFPARKEYQVKDLQYTFENQRTAAIYTKDSINELSYFKTVWGSKYEKVYNTPVNAQVATLDSLFGGLTVISERSNADYRALQLKDAQGNIYRMRSLGKNALKYKERIAKNINVEVNEEGDTEINENIEATEKDVSFYTASHPYASMALPRLAEEIGIFYTKPRLYYVPKQRKLGRFNENFGDELYLISLEPNENSVGQSTFKYPDDVETTDDILIKLRNSGKVRLDERNYLKSRLFDMLVGDWDREKDRWRWAEFFNSDSLNVFVPIPKNRDDAFSSFEGNILDVASSVFGKNTQRHLYDEDLVGLSWFNKEGIIFDRSLLQRAGRNQWKFIAKEIRESITDAVIEDAFSNVPPEVQEETLDEIKKNLKGRRDQLEEIADRYYTMLVTLQTIASTDGEDLLKITRLDEGKTQLKIYRKLEDKTLELVVDRTFNNDDTKELWVYGLDGNDRFEVENNIPETAASEKFIFVRLIGGIGNDEYAIKDGTRIKVYDHETLENTYEEVGGANLRKTDIYNHNTYDYRKQINRTKDLTAALGYNPDDGFKVGLQFSYQKDGFQRNPFSYRHVINTAYFADTQSYDINYVCEFANFRNNKNLNYSVYITSPNYVQNYFGYGNETQNNQDDLGYDFNRINIQKINGTIGLVRNSPFGSFFKAQLKLDTYNVKKSFNFSLPTETAFQVDETAYFSSIEAVYSYRSYDKASNPSRGLMFDFNPVITTNVQSLQRTFGYLNTRLGFYNSLVKSKKLVLKTNVNGKFNFGNKFEFYQGVTIGGNTGLRAYREERFTGKSALVGNADLRYSFDEFKLGLIPLQLGLYGGADIGRVWIPSGESEKWHNSYGGGLWINGPGGLNGTFSAFTSTESTRVSFGLGFKF